jgi:uncharacterized protein YydD (DUF2326 family)
MIAAIYARKSIEERFHERITEEQQAILREAFHHVWSRMEGLHAELNDDSLRVSSALEVLTERGLLTDEEMDQVMARLHVEGGHEAKNPRASLSRGSRRQS